MRKGLMFGCFDLFHIGHLKYFQQAKKYCDWLIVVIADDDFVKEKKKHDPLFSLKYRMEIIKAIKFVDEVDWYGKRNKQKVVFDHWPDIIFYNDQADNKLEYLRLGIELKELKYYKEISSTKIKEMLCKIQKK